MQYVQLLLFGVAIGVLSGLLGIGGGIMLIPGLMLLFGFSQQEAQGTSLAAMVPPIGIFAALVYYQHGYVRLPVAAVVAIGFMVGAFLGAKLVPHMPLHWLRLAFGGLLLYLGVTFVFGSHLPRTLAALPAGVSAVLVFIGAWLKRSQPRKPRRNLPPPGEDVEYHI